MSYLLSDDGVSGKDCIDGDGCSTICGRFTPPFNPTNPLAPLIGGFRLVCAQKLMITDVCIVIIIITSRHLTVNLDVCWNLNRLLTRVLRTV